MTESQPNPDGPFAIEPADLLRHAKAVAEDLPNATQTDYRRAVSAAYFALFHALTLRVTELFAHGDLSEQYRATRRFGHGQLRLVCEWVTGTPPRRFNSRVATLRFDVRVRSVAGAFAFLQKERVEADYDHSAEFTSRRAAAAVARARDAVTVVADAAFGASDPGMEFLRLASEAGRLEPEEAEGSDGDT